MPDHAEAVLAVCAALARLQVRLLAKLPEARRMPNGVVRLAKDSDWCLADLDWVSPWLDQVAAAALISNVVPRVALAQAHLLAMLDADAIDPRRACLAVHHICGGGQWSGMVLRMARQLGVTLAETPFSELHGPLRLEMEPLPKRRR